MARVKKPKAHDATLSLFPEGPPSPTSEYVGKNRDRLADWASKGILFGSSSWKYPGWRGMVYNRKYASQRDFEHECLAEYAALFPTVCADFALYDFPARETMERISEDTPDGFLLALKVTDRITVRRYPKIPRYGSMAGAENPDFLNIRLFEDAFLRPLDALGKKRGAIIFEFSTFYPNSGVTDERFVDLLEEFLSKLPPGYSYAVEIRNAEFLTENYLALLRSHGVAHVLNNWTRMPPVIRQLDVSGVLTTDFSVIRALLKPGRTYEQAVQTFKPYDRIKEENPELREGIVEAVHRCVAEGKRLYVYVNNRAEGNSPKTIEGILDTLEQYPAKKL
jgi:uncharacterized protein YecE (DUF72 family)